MKERNDDDKMEGKGGVEGGGNENENELEKPRQMNRAELQETEPSIYERKHRTQDHPRATPEEP